MIKDVPKEYDEYESDNFDDSYTNFSSITIPKHHESPKKRKFEETTSDDDNEFGYESSSSSSSSDDDEEFLKPKRKIRKIGSNQMGKRAQKMYMKNLKIPNLMRSKIMKEVMSYLSYAHSPVLSFVRKVAGFTDHKMEFYIEDVPYEAKKFIDAYHLVNEEMALMGVYYELFFKIFEVVKPLEAVQTLMKKKESAEKLQIKINELKKSEEEEEGKSLEKTEKNLKKLKREIDVWKEVVIKKGDEDPTKDIPPQEPFGKYVVDKIGGSIFAVKSHHTKKFERVLGFHKQKFKKLEYFCKESFCPYVNIISSSIEGIFKDLDNFDKNIIRGQDISHKLTQPVQIGTKLTGSFDLSDEGLPKKWDIKDLDHDYFIERVRRSIFHHMRKMRVNLSKNKLYSHLKFGIPIRYKSTFEARVDEALQDVKGQCNDKDNLIRVETILKQDNVMIKFARLVSLYLRMGEFDWNARNDRGAYRAYRNKEGYREERNYILNWFRGMRFDGTRFVSYNELNPLGFITRTYDDGGIQRLGSLEHVLGIK
jgi:hypothetical protein